MYQNNRFAFSRLLVMYSISFYLNYISGYFDTNSLSYHKLLAEHNSLHIILHEI